MLPLITMYGATDCDDTERTRNHLIHLGIPFTEINIDDDAAAEQFVIFINNGWRSTPTLVMNQGKQKQLITEPTDTELEELLKRVDFLLS